MAGGQMFGIKNRGLRAGCDASVALKMPRNSCLSSPLPPMSCSSPCHDRPSPSRASPFPVAPPDQPRHRRRCGGHVYAMGRIPMCKCGTIKLWYGGRGDSEMSQHLTDWYSYSHVLHGIIFYWLLSVVAKGRLSVAARLVIAMGIEARLGDLREHALHHQPLSRPDRLARLLRRQHRQLGGRHAVRCWWASCSPRACRPG